jgi:hypothetical protein
MTACPKCATPARPGAKFCRNCGEALSPSAPLSPSPSTAAAAIGRLGRRLLIILIAVAVVATAYGGFQALQKFYPPDEPVKAFFAALAARDAELAASLTIDVNRVLWKGDILRQGYEPPTDVRIGAIHTATRPTTPAGRTRTGGRQRAVQRRRQPQRTTVTVSRGGSGLTRSWGINGGTKGYVDPYSASAKEFRLAGLTVTVPIQRRIGPGHNGAVELLPGGYTVSTTPDDLLFDAARDLVVVATGVRDPIEVQPKLTLKPSAVTEIKRLVKANIDECAKREDVKPRGCPFTQPGVIVSPTNIRWRSTGIRTSTCASTTTARIVVRTVKPGQATVTYNSVVSVGGGRADTTASVPVEPSGTAGVDANAITYAP